MSNRARRRKKADASYAGLGEGSGPRNLPIGAACIWSEMNAGNVVQPNKDVAAESPPKGDGSGMVPSPRPTGPSLRLLGLTWAVLDVQPMGYGSVAWIKVGPGAQNIGVSARGGGLRIGETGQVPEIEVENLGDAAVLLPAHLVLSGGWQTRSVERSAVVPARHTARVPVKCVEAGRWAPRDERTGSSFEVSERMSVRTRWSTSGSMSEQLTRHGRFTAEQSAVWQHVEEELARTPEPSNTRSYEAYLRGVKRRHIEAVRAVHAHPRPRPTRRCSSSAAAACGWRRIPRPPPSPSKPTTSSPTSSTPPSRTRPTSATPRRSRRPHRAVGAPHARDRAHRRHPRRSPRDRRRRGDP